MKKYLISFVTVLALSACAQGPSDTQKAINDARYMAEQAHADANEARNRAAAAEQQAKAARQAAEAATNNAAVAATAAAAASDRADRIFRQGQNK